MDYAIDDHRTHTALCVTLTVECLSGFKVALADGTKRIVKP